MNINANIRIINQEGGSLAYFTDKKDMYTKLSGIKDSKGENAEFFEVGKKLQLNDNIFEIRNINVKSVDINNHISHSNKSNDNFSSEYYLELILTVE